MPPDFSAARGEYVQIMVNNVTVILVLRDTCKINTTIHPLAHTVPVPSNVRIHNNSASLFWCCIVSTVDRLNNTTRRHECVPQRMFAWLTINTMLRVPYRTDSDSKIIKRQQRHCTSYNAIHLTVSRIIHAVRFQSRTHSLRTPKELRALNRLLSEWVTVTLSGSASSQ